MLATFYDARRANDSYESYMISVSHSFGTSVIQWDVEWSLQTDSVYQEVHRCTDDDTFLRHIFVYLHRDAHTRRLQETPTLRQRVGLLNKSISRIISGSICQTRCMNQYVSMTASFTTLLPTFHKPNTDITRHNNQLD